MRGSMGGWSMPKGSLGLRYLPRGLLAVPVGDIIRPRILEVRILAVFDGRSCNMTTLREQIATTALTVTKFRELLRTMRENRPSDDLELVRKAYEFSQRIHTGQTRASGEPYLVHPLSVARVLAEM